MPPHLSPVLQEFQDPGYFLWWLRLTMLLHNSGELWQQINWKCAVTSSVGGYWGILRSTDLTLFAAKQRWNEVDRLYKYERKIKRLLTNFCYEIEAWSQKPNLKAPALPLTSQKLSELTMLICSPFSSPYNIIITAFCDLSSSSQI